MKIKIGILCGDQKINSAVESVLHKILDGRLDFSVEVSPKPDKIYDSTQTAKQAAVSQIMKTNINDVDYYISIVNAIERDFDTMYGFTFSVVSNSTKSKFGFGTSARYPLPDDIVISIENKGSFSDLKQIIGENSNLVSFATGGLLTAEELASKSVSVALIPFNFFPIDPPETAAPELTRFIDEINPIDRSSLTSQLRQLDFTQQKIVDTNQVLRSIETVSDPVDFDELYDAVYTNGVDAIKNGEVGVCIMAGGQGSRLRAPVPKALMEFGLPSRMTLLELQIRRIKKLMSIFNNYGQNVPSIPLYILTSESTHSAIAAYLAEHGNFGLDHIMLVKQPQLPARLIDPNDNDSQNNSDGPFILSEKWKILASPNGNGAIFAALKDSGAIDDMKKRGVLYLDVHPIDNALVRPADPFMVGCMLYEGGDVAIKVIRKNPKEKIGTIAKRGDKTVVIEYSEIPDDQDQKFVWGNTGIHLYSLDVIERAANAELPYHIALKKENIINDKGEKIMAGVKKFERFIFDALEYAENTVLVECVREDEFAPIKNSPGSPVDSPDTALNLLVSLHKRWAIDAEIELEGEGILEFLPETTYAGEGIDTLLLSSITLPFSA